MAGTVSTPRSVAVVGRAAAAQKQPEPRSLRTGGIEFFASENLDRARDVYPHYDFARMNENEFETRLALD